MTGPVESLGLPTVDKSIDAVRAILSLAAVVVEDLQTNEERYASDLLASWRACGVDFYGEPTALTIYREDSSSLVMVNSNLRPVEQLRSLLHQIDEGLGHHNPVNR